MNEILDFSIVGVIGVGVGLLPYLSEMRKSRARKRYAEFVTELFVVRVRLQRTLATPEEKRKEFKRAVREHSLKLFRTEKPPPPTDVTLRALFDKMEPLEVNLPCQRDITKSCG